MSIIKDLNPMIIAMASSELKGGDLFFEAGDEFYVCKNMGGKYSAPYEVIAQCSTVSYGEACYGTLVLVDTHVDSYFDHVSNMDIVGLTEEDVLGKISMFVAQAKKNKAERKQRMKEFKL